MHIFKIIQNSNMIYAIPIELRGVLFKTNILNTSFFCSNAAPKTTYMAKSSEVIEKKVFQSFLCAPSFKKEIMDLGNKGNLAIQYV